MSATLVLDEFTVGYKIQREWGWLILSAFFLGGMGAGLFLISMFLEFVPGMVAGFMVVALGKTTAHIMFLGRPERFWRAFLRPFSSWISRGIWVVGFFVVFSALHLAPSLEWFSGLPWTVDSGLGQVIQALAGFFAFLLMIYTGFVMSYSPSIPFWNTTLLPVLFVLYSAMGGMAGLFVLLPFVSHEGVDVKLLELTEITLVVAAFVLLFVYLVTMINSTVGAKESVRALVRGELALVFIVGVLFFGMMVPLLAAVYSYYAELGTAVASVLLVMAGALELMGGFLFRYSLLRVGYYNPLI